jgi:hypothetical protein
MLDWETKFIVNKCRILILKLHWKNDVLKSVCLSKVSSKQQKLDWKSKKTVNKCRRLEIKDALKSNALNNQYKKYEFLQPLFLLKVVTSPWEFYLG